MWKHSTNHRLRVFCGNRVLKQFLATVDEEYSEEESNLAEVLEEVVINMTKGPDNIDTNKEGDGRVHVHLATITKDDTTASFVGILQENIVLHTVSVTIPTRRDTKFEGVLIDTGAA